MKPLVTRYKRHDHICAGCSELIEPGQRGRLPLKTEDGRRWHVLCWERQRPAPLPGPRVRVSDLYPE